MKNKRAEAVKKLVELVKKVVEKYKKTGKICVLLSFVDNFGKENIQTETLFVFDNIAPEELVSLFDATLKHMGATSPRLLASLLALRILDSLRKEKDMTAEAEAEEKSEKEHEMIFW